MHRVKHMSGSFVAQALQSSPRLLRASAHALRVLIQACPDHSVNTNRTVLVENAKSAFPTVSSTIKPRHLMKSGNRISSTLTFLLLLCGCTTHAQDFEGVVVYGIHYLSIDDATSMDDWAARYGTRAELFFKEGNSLLTYNGTHTKAHLYRRDIHRRFMRIASADSLLETDLSKPNFEWVDHRIRDEQETILGHASSILETNVRLGNTPATTFTYFYHPALTISSHWFTDIAYNNEDAVYAITRSIPLKMVFEYPTYRITWTAQEIKKQKLEDHLFDPASL